MSVPTYSRAPSQTYPALNSNLYVGAWNVQPASLAHENVAETIKKMQEDGESDLNAIVISGAFGLVVEVDTSHLERQTIVEDELYDSYGIAKTSNQDLYGLHLEHAEKEMVNRVVALADHLKYPNALLIPYNDKFRRTEPEDSTHRLEYRQYMAAFSDKHVKLTPGRLGARNNVELSLQFADATEPTIIDGAHFDERSKVARSEAMAHFAAKQANAAHTGRRILMGDLNIIGKHRKAARVIAAIERNMPHEKMKERAARLTNMLESTPPLRRLVEMHMYDALDGSVTDGFVDTDHAYYDPRHYYPTHLQTYRSHGSAHKAIAVSFVPGTPDNSGASRIAINGTIPECSWKDMNYGENSKWNHFGSLLALEEL